MAPGAAWPLNKGLVEISSEGDKMIAGAGKK